MLDILIFLRFKQLLAHNLHNFTSGEAFFADHEFFGSFYAQAEGQYDSVIERMIGLGVDVNPVAVQQDACKLLAQVGFPNQNPFELLQTAEQELCEAIEKEVKAGKLSQGTIQLLGNIADQAEMNLYKIKRRQG